MSTTSNRASNHDKCRGPSSNACHCYTLGEDWLRGAEQVALALSDEGVNRCLLLTDALANVGITDRDALARHAGALRARGVSTTTFGVGEDFDEVLLQTMAAAGGGHFYFIATPASIRDHITSEVGETLEVVPAGVTLEIGTCNLCRAGRRENGRVSYLAGIRQHSAYSFATYTLDVGGGTVIVVGVGVAAVGHGSLTVSHRLSPEGEKDAVPVGA